MSDAFVKFSYPLKVIERHLDTFGHMNNATYLEVLEEARWDFINQRGYGMAKIRESALGPTILECNIKFMKELRLHQNVVIETQTTSCAGKIAILKQVILNENNESCAEAVFTVALFDLKARKLVLPTPEWLYAIGVSEAV